ncbi:MAG: thiolase family protein [Deltaproteobacteria bacterium]|jgi:acetyl-CoA acyltransferase|nr:thiolase family protein [Deltaproteobacteria bacterium]MBT4639742.1 thiolase family protein [Deltaproteobacteria bacterium]
MSDNVYIYGTSMIKFGKYLDRSIKNLAGDALESVLTDCSLEKSQLEAAWYSNSFQGIFDFQHCIRGQVALTANGLDKIPVTNVENACASASTALNGAWMAIKSGQFDCALVIGAEKIYNEDRKLMMGSYSAGTDVEVTKQMIEQLKKEEAKAKSKSDKEADGAKKQGHSAFMDIYAFSARQHMQKYGTTQRQLAVVAAKAHNNSTMNPLAQYQFPQTVEQVMADYEVAFPLTRSMCAPTGDGAAAAIVCSEKFLRENPNPRAVLIRASVMSGGSLDPEDQICARASSKAYHMAGLGPKDIDVVEVHDATAFGELSTIEKLGFCEKGEGGPFSESGATALDGSIPFNPSGGLISRGHPVGASGLAQIYELVTQLRGEAGERQVDDPRIALAENGGGTIGHGAAALCIHILERT